MGPGDPRKLDHWSAYPSSVSRCVRKGCIDTSPVSVRPATQKRLLAIESPFNCRSRGLSRISSPVRLLPGRQACRSASRGCNSHGQIVTSACLRSSGLLTAHLRDDPNVQTSRADNPLSTEEAPPPAEQAQQLRTTGTTPGRPVQEQTNHSQRSQRSTMKLANVSPMTTLSALIVCGALGGCGGGDEVAATDTFNNL